MNPVVVVVAAIWILPIIGIVIAYLWLTRSVGKQLTELSSDRLIESEVDARETVRTTVPAKRPVSVGHDDPPRRIAQGPSDRLAFSSLRPFPAFALALN